MRIGRDLWKIENEAFNVLKKKEYNLQHNFGHGKANLSNNLILMNLIAFFVHYLSEYLIFFIRKLVLYLELVLIFLKDWELFCLLWFLNHGQNFRIILFIYLKKQHKKEECSK